MRTLQEIAYQMEKLMTEAYQRGRNHAYVKGVRDAKKLIDQELNFDEEESK